MGELIHCDYSGKMAVPTAGGAHFFILLIDDYTRRAAPYLMKHKSEALTKLKHYIENHRNTTPILFVIPNRSTGITLQVQQTGV
jgi:hypothetical protein